MSAAVTATQPLLTLPLHQRLLAGRAAGGQVLDVSLDLGRSTVPVQVDADGWSTPGGARFPYAAVVKERTVYRWVEDAFQPVSRFGGGGLIKLVPTDWGPPTFEIDGIKMLPTAQVSPWDDARRKVGLVQPRGKVVLDCCGGLGYFAAWCLAEGAAQVISFEKNPDVVWLRGINPWSPKHGEAPGADVRLTLTEGDVSKRIAALPAQSVDAILHDPPRFGIAGELYSQAFYNELARVIRPRGRLFHYTGTPNKLTSGRDVPREVAGRLLKAGFATELNGDGVVGIRGGR